MRHRVAYRKLGRVTEHRLSLLRNQATDLLRHEHLTTTVPKAKELRPFVERLITIAKRSRATGGAGDGRALHARRLVMQDLQDRGVVAKLFDTIAPRFAERPGGYTRLLRVGYRKGDSAEVAQVELVGSEYNPRPKAEATPEAAAASAKKKPGVGGRLRAAAERLRGKNPESAASESAAASQAQAAKRSAARKASAGRKMGGS